MTTKEMIKVMQAAEAGKPIEFRSIGSGDSWKHCDIPVWDWCETEYRVKPLPKTLMHFTEIPDDMSPRFLELDGDYRRLDKVFINSVNCDDALQDELNRLIYDEETGKVKVQFSTAPTKDWDYFIHCGFYC